MREFIAFAFIVLAAISGLFGDPRGVVLCGVALVVLTTINQWKLLKRAWVLNSWGALGLAILASIFIAAGTATVSGAAGFYLGKVIW